jgi:hypothetical protein
MSLADRNGPLKDSQNETFEWIELRIFRGKSRIEVSL